MTDCPQCGSRTDPKEAFCSTCGEFLGWVGTHADSPATAGPSEEPSATAPEPVELSAGQPRQQDDDGVARFQAAVRDAESAAARASEEAAQAAVRLERVERRAQSAQRRVERLSTQLPEVGRTASDAAQALERAEAAAERAAALEQAQRHEDAGRRLADAAGRRTAAEQEVTAATEQRDLLGEESSPADRTAAEQRLFDAQEHLRRAKRAERDARRLTERDVPPDGTPLSPEHAALQTRLTAAVEAREVARAAANAAQEAAATLEGVCAGAQGEVESAPAELRAAKAALKEARLVQEQRAAAVEEATAELALHERLLRLRAQPRAVVLMREDEEAARVEARATAATAAERRRQRTEEEEERERRRAEQEDRRRFAAEDRADALELGALAEGAGAAARAATTAEGSESVQEPPTGLQGAVARVRRTAPPPPPARVRAEKAAGVAAAEPDDEPDAMMPSAVRRRARAQSVVAGASGDGPVRCADCGAGNEEGRHLCRRCGQPLVPEPQTEPERPRLPWWRRLAGRADRPAGRGRGAPALLLPAGARPGFGGRRGPSATTRRAVVGGQSALRQGARLQLALPVVALAVVSLLVAGLFLTPTGARLRGDIVTDEERLAEDLGLTSVPVPVLRTRASSSAPDSPPLLAVDGDPLTSWQPAAGPGEGEVLTLELAEPVDVVQVEIVVAPGKDRARPASLTVVGDSGGPLVLRLADTSAIQRLALGAGKTSTITLQIEEVYPGTGAAGFAEVVLRSTRQPAR